MDLNIELLPWQQEVWADDTRFKIVAAGRRTGKSRLAAWMLIVNALQADSEAVGCLIGCLIGWLFGWLVIWSVG